MNCQEVQAKLLDFIDYQIDENEKTVIEQHLEDCEECKSQHFNWQDTICTIRETKDHVYSIAESATIKNNVMKRIEMYESHKKTFTRNIKVWNRLASIAAAFAIMFIGYAGYNHSSITEQPDATLLVEEQSVTELGEKKGDVVRIASYDEIASNYSVKNVAPYSLGGIFLGIGAASIVMRRKLEKQLNDFL